MIVIPTETYRALAAALANLKPDWFADKITVDDVKIALGEIGDIWPASIFDETEEAEASCCIAP